MTGRWILTLTAALGLSLAATTPAQARPAAPALFNQQRLISQATTSRCIWTDGTASDWARTYKACTTGDKHFTWSSVGAFICGGTDVVDGNGTTCPFAIGSGLNDLYAGDTIIFLKNPDSGLRLEHTCCAQEGFEVQPDAANRKQAFVQDASCATKPGCGLINPDASDGLPYRHEADLCDEGEGARLDWENTATAPRCLWVAA